ncbi:MAG TPA: hypothetical protein VNW15_02405 [Rhizomicrobium sp.]|nr:hypothetical protein [Rhizomicrobium sp.]
MIIPSNRYLGTWHTVGSWAGFFSVIGSASAALLGLLFVSISINAPATLGKGQDHSRRLAEQAFQNYLAVLMVSLLALIPDMSLTTFSKVTLLITGIWVVWVFIRLYQGMMGEGSIRFRIRSLRRHVTSLIGYAMLVITALRMALTGEDERDWFAVAVIILLFSATRVCWQFLVRIAETEEKKPR